MKLADSIEIMPGKLNTKVIFDQKGVKSTLFACPNEFVIPEHSSPNDAILVMLEGTARIHMNGNIHELSSGEWIEFKEKVPHSLVGVTDFKMLLTR